MSMRANLSQLDAFCVLAAWLQCVHFTLEASETHSNLVSRSMPASMGSLTLLQFPLLPLSTERDEEEFPRRRLFATTENVENDGNNDGSKTHNDANDGLIR